MNAIRCVLLLSMLSAATGCGYMSEHTYKQYLDANKGVFQFPYTGYEAHYYIAPQVRNLLGKVFYEPMGPDYQMAPVLFGSMLMDTLESDDYQAAFYSLSETTEAALDEGLLFRYEEARFEFKDYRAHISLRIVATLDGQEILVRTFQKDGPSQSVRNFITGHLGIAHSVEISTKWALERLLSDSLLKFQIEMDAEIWAE